jgi:hypothetical protein
MQRDKQDVIAGYQQKERDRHFNLAKDVLIRVTLLRTGQDEYDFIWSYHHILMDGWSIAVLWNEFKSLYVNYRLGYEFPAGEPGNYAAYINWLESRDKQEAIRWLHGRWCSTRNKQSCCNAWRGTTALP